MKDSLKYERRSSISFSRLNVYCTHQRLQERMGRAPALENPTCKTAYTILVLLASSRIQITQDCWFKIDTQKDGCFWQCFATQPITRDRPNFARHVIKFSALPLRGRGGGPTFNPQNSVYEISFSESKRSVFLFAKIKPPILIYLNPTRC